MATILEIGKYLAKEGENDPRLVLIHPGTEAEARQALEGRMPEGCSILDIRKYERTTEIRVCFPGIETTVKSK